MRKKIAVLSVALIAAGVSLATASLAPAATRDSNSIWIVTADNARAGQLNYGSSFKAGYSSRAREPWGYARCWDDGTSLLGVPNMGTYAPGDPIWAAYRSLTGLTGDSFLLADPIQGLWLGGGARCILNLVTFSGSKQSTLASTAFTVAG